MGGRGKFKATGGAGRASAVTAATENFEKKAEDLFLKYGIDRKGGTLVYEKLPPPKVREWIKANKEKLIKWKQSVDIENEKKENYFREIKNTVYISKKIKEGREFYKIQVPVLKTEGLRKKIENRIEPDINGTDAKTLWRRLSREWSEQPVFVVHRNDLRKFTGY